jgi:hypothetical protein
MKTPAAGGGNGGTGVLARAALAGAACFAVSALLLSLFSEYTLAGDCISELAIGRFGFVQTLAFLAFGIGSLALAVGLRRATKGSRGSIVGTILFGLFGAGVIVDAFFPIDRGGMQPETVVGTVNILAALVAFVCAILGMFGSRGPSSGTPGSGRTGVSPWRWRRPRSSRSSCRARAHGQGYSSASSWAPS